MYVYSLFQRTFLNIFWCAPLGYLYFYIFMFEPDSGTGIDPGMALTPFPSIVG